MKHNNDKHIVEEKDGWYFWDEVGQDKYGPYKDIEEARYMMDKYCVEVLGLISPLPQVNW